MCITKPDRASFILNVILKIYAEVLRGFPSLSLPIMPQSSRIKHPGHKVAIELSPNNYNCSLHLVRY